MARLQGKGFMEDSPDAMKLTFDDEVGFGWELREDKQLQRQWPTPTPPRGLVKFDQQYNSRDHDHPHRMKSVLQIEKNKANNLKASIIRKKHGYDNVGAQNPIGYDEGEGDEGEENYSPNFHSKSACITSFLTSRRPFDAEDKVEKSHAVIPLEKSEKKVEDISSKGYSHSASSAPAAAHEVQDSDVIPHNTNKVSRLVEAIEKMQFPAVEIVDSGENVGGHEDDQSIAITHDHNGVPEIGPTPIYPNEIMPDEIVKPIKEEPKLELSLQPIDEGKDNAGRDIVVSTEQDELHPDSGGNLLPSMGTQWPGEAMANATEYTLGLGSRNEPVFDEEGKPILMKVKGIIETTKECVMESGGSVKDPTPSLNTFQSVKTWDEWASEEIKSAQNSVNGFMFPKQAKTNDLYEPKPQTKGTSQSDANKHGEGLSGAVEIVSSVVGKVVGIALGLKDVLVYEMGGIKCNASNASETEIGMKEKEEKFNQKMADEEGVQYNRTTSKSKFYAETALSAKNAIASKLGYGDELKAHVQGKKPEKDEYAMRFDGGADQNKKTLKNSIVCKLCPGEEDKALSEVITDAVSHGAICVKEVLAGGLLQRGSDRTE
eukprot:Gb_39318 [translate_table: standard]